MRFKSQLVCGVMAGLAFVAVAAAQEAPRVFTRNDDIRLPQVIREIKPSYTEEAKQRGIEGTVVLDAVVLADGTVGEVRVKQSLDSTYGLDEQAVKALKQWLFKPGTKDGTPVAVRVDVEMTFTLK
jgi:protein TonB